MINEKQVERFCKEDLSKIKNYEAVKRRCAKGGR